MSTAFRLWLHENLPEVLHFSADEFLFKGEAHATNGLNTDPPPELWPNLVPLARVLEALRVRLGKPIALRSIYRSPAYNKAVSGASASFHMQFKAADFVVVGLGTPPDWAATLRAMRAGGLFKGGIGTYDTFVHVDVRGENVDFDYRKGPKPTGRVLGASGAAETAPDRPAVTMPPKPSPAPSERLSLWQWLAGLLFPTRGAA